MTINIRTDLELMKRLRSATPSPSITPPPSYESLVHVAVLSRERMPSPHPHQYQHAQKSNNEQQGRPANLLYDNRGRVLMRMITRVVNTPRGIMTIYFLCNLTMTLYSKIIMKLFRFEFPWLLTLSHALFSAAGSAFLIWGLKLIKPTTFMPSRHESVLLLLFSLLYTGNIAISNVSLSMVSLPFHQIVRSTNPAFTITLEWLFLKKRHRTVAYISLIPVILGVACATYGEYEVSTWMGVVLTFIGVLLSASKGLATNALLVGNLSLHPVELLYRMSVLACLQSIPMSYMAGEVAGYREYVRILALYRERYNDGSLIVDDPLAHRDHVRYLSLHGLFLALVLNSMLAFALNVASFSANKRTSALSMTVAGNVKQVLTVVLSMWIFSYVISLLNGLGILMTLMGGMWYSCLSQPRRCPSKPTMPPASPKKDEILRSSTYQSPSGGSSAWAKSLLNV
ncbi:hypothetical protein SeMB42_g01648 [Synchytrium endobioticum]|uniref:Sugar phosphate transporter domain-containing protein n=1 Tax=Synchytrium endobioticum TaxID=286115 RepID=A0A507DK60_9FUNG|nr:hypothetical protein SeLEV6574_g06563 [Synchytrium endobioticum]TPX52089.1 hypothetical protein SeMB42_g01648 [Synchytrium endobioticum]